MAAHIIVGKQNTAGGPDKPLKSPLQQPSGVLMPTYLRFTSSNMRSPTTASMGNFNKGLMRCKINLRGDRGVQEK